MFRLWAAMMLVTVSLGGAAQESEPKDKNTKADEDEAQRSLWIVTSHMRKLAPGYGDALNRVDRLRSRLWQLDRDRPADEKPEARKKTDEAIRAIAREVAAAKKKLIDLQAGFVEKKLPANPFIAPDVVPRYGAVFEIKPQTPEEEIDRELGRIQFRLQLVESAFKDALKKREQLRKRKKELEQSLADAEDPKNKEKIMEGLKETASGIAETDKQITDRQNAFIRRLLASLYESGDVLKTDNLVKKYSDEKEGNAPKDKP